MFCIINLRHNSTYVAPPAAGGPPFFSTHASPVHGEEVFVRSRTTRPVGVLVIRDTVSSNTIKSKHCNDGAVPIRMNKDAARTRSDPKRNLPPRNLHA